MKTKEKPAENSGNKDKQSGISKGIVGTILAVALEFIWKNRNDIVDLVKRIFAKKPKEPVKP